MEKLGKYMIFDTTMSNPTGYACVQCHAYTAGFTSGLEPIVNVVAGVPPGVIPGRWDNRKALHLRLRRVQPGGPLLRRHLGAWFGGNFWDGRAYDTAVQAQGPPINPNEMNNTPAGTAPNQYPPLLVKKLQSRPYTPLIKQIYGADVFTKYTPRQIYEIWGEAIAAYEATGEVCAFSSKYDASKYGVPRKKLYKLSASEERGRVLYFGGAQCFQCHSSAAMPGIGLETEGKETFTMYCFANIGVPKNPGNPYYQMTDQDQQSDRVQPARSELHRLRPRCQRRRGARWDGKFFNTTPGDITQFRGLFLTPTTRNSDLRPYPTFVKAYFHNGWAKSLQQVVHFYNTRNIAVNAAGQQVAFDLLTARRPATRRSGHRRRSSTTSRTSRATPPPRRPPREPPG